MGHANRFRSPSRRDHSRTTSRRSRLQIQAEFAASEKQAQQAYDDAIDAIEPLVEEARSSGLDPKLIELYEAGLTRPAR